MVATREQEKSDWLAIQIPRSLAEEMEEFSNSTAGKNMGFTKKSQTVATACREFLERHKPKELILTNSKQDRNLVFTVSGGKPKCVLHNSDDCECVVELRQSRTLKRLAKRKGFEIKG